jgi:predicted S18 family serine protease
VTSVEKISFHNYYDGGVVKENEVKKRWRVKTLADPKRNLTKSNYRKRLYKENNACQATDRKFLSFIIGNESDSFQKFILAQNEIDDKKVLDEKIKEIQTHYNNLIRSNENKLKEQELKLNQTFHSQKNSLKIEYESKFIFLQLTASQYEIHRLAQELKEKYEQVEKAYEDVLVECRSLYKAQSNELRFSCKNRINALNTLYKSGKYEKGKLGEYFSLTVNQGISIRRKYFDNGERLILLPEDKLKYILIEDLIYSYFYAKNK